jgi:hypothetical protein
MDKCTNCGAKINANEPACVFAGKVVCVRCDQTLRASAEVKERDKLKFDVPPGPARAGEGNSYLRFDRMIAPEAIKVLHVLMLIAATLGSLGILIVGAIDIADKDYSGAGISVMALFATWLAYLGFRIMCEFLIVQFKIKELLEK